MASEKVLELSSDPLVQDFGQGSITFVGTATVIVRWGGFVILTDPNFLHKGDHVHLGYGIHSQRQTDPAMELEDLPPIDFIVLSHLHEDHFDRFVEQHLNRSIPIISTPHAAAKLTSKGFSRMIALQTWESIRVSKGAAALRLTAMPGRHAPGLLHHLRVLPPVMGSMIDFEHVGQPLRFRLYISGDTLIHDDIREIPRRFADVDLALLHLGGTRVLGLLVTMDARQGVRMLQLLQPRRAIPIHYNDYDAFKSPLEDFQREVERAGLAERVSYIYAGDTVDFTLARPGAPSQVGRLPGPLSRPAAAGAEGPVAAASAAADAAAAAEQPPPKESTTETVEIGAAGLETLMG